MSYDSTWNYLRLLTTQAQYTDMVRTEHWIWVYDNLNIHQRVRHERTGKGDNKSFFMCISIKFTYSVYRSPLRNAQPNISHSTKNTKLA